MKIKNLVKKVKSYKASKLVIILASITIGSLLTLTIQAIIIKNSQPKFINYHQQIAKDFFDDDFFDDHLEFFEKVEERHRKIREKMRENFAKHEKIFHNSSNFKQAVISTKEGEDYFSYILKFKQFDKDEIEVKVKDKMLKIWAHKKEKSENNKVKSQSDLQFSYSFTLPKNLDLDDYKIIRQKGQIEVKFKKD